MRHLSNVLESLSSSSSSSKKTNYESDVVRQLVSTSSRVTNNTDPTGTSTTSNNNNNNKRNKNSVPIDSFLMRCVNRHNTEKEESTSISSFSYATLARYLLHVVAVVKNDEDEDDTNPQQQSILWKSLCQLIPALLMTSPKSEFLIWSTFGSDRIRQLVSSDHNTNAAVFDFILATATGVSSPPHSIVTTSSLVQSSLATFQNWNPQQRTSSEGLISIYHLYLLGHSFRLDTIVEVLSTLLPIIFFDNAICTDTSILTWLYLQQFLKEMENVNPQQQTKKKKAAAMMKVIRLVFQLYDQIIVILSKNDHHHHQPTKLKLLEHVLECIICHYLSMEGSINQSTLPVSLIVEYVWKKMTRFIMEHTAQLEQRMSNTILQQESANPSKEEKMSIRVIEMWIRSDPIKVAPEIIKWINGNGDNNNNFATIPKTLNSLLLVRLDCTFVVTIMEALLFHIPYEWMDPIRCMFERYVHVVVVIQRLLLSSTNDTNLNYFVMDVLENVATVLYLLSQQKEMLENVNLTQTRSVLHELICSSRKSDTNHGPSPNNSTCTLDRFHYQTQLCFLQFGWNVLAAKNKTTDAMDVDDKEQSTTPVVSRLSSALFHHLARLVPRSLKMYFKKRTTPMTTTNGTATTDLHVHNPTVPIGLLNKFLPLLGRGEDEEDGQYDPESSILPSSELIGIIDAVIKACLRYGIGICTTLEQCTVQLECIRLVRTIVGSLTKDDCSMDQSTTTFGFRLRQEWQTINNNNKKNTKGVDGFAWDVFEMCTTHSKFGTAMANGVAVDNDNIQGIQSCLRLELTTLLYDCLDVARDRLVYDENVWNVFLSSYNAGMNELDQKVHALLHRYTTKAPEGSSATFLDQWKWGNPDSSTLVDDQKSVHDVGWDWFPSSIDLHRIHATIANFPIDVALSTSTSSSSHMIVDNNNTIPLVSETNGTDKRYNPAFLLPMILGALQNDAETNRREQASKWKTNRTEMGHHHGSRDDYYHPSSSAERPDTFPAAVGWDGSMTKSNHWNNNNGIQFIQRLCGKGIVGLALCSLCSNCPNIRRVGFSVVGLLLSALNSKDAYDYQTNHHHHKKWNERPQLEMILNSIVRAYAILYYNTTTNTDGDNNKMDDDDDDDDKDEHPNDRPTVAVVVPKVSSFTAVFLAKTSLILMHPSDPMYIAANRYFLRSEMDCGAYQDMFQLPAFLFLFTSSVLDDEQRKRERKFAIELIRDGLVGGPDGYKLLVSSYVPDLLLTSLESSHFIASTSGDGETILVFRTLEKMILNGGDRSKQHIIGRLGILSWIRSYLQTPSFRTVVVTTNAFVAFLRLVKTVVTNSIPIVPSNEIEVSCTGIPEAIMEQCLYYYDLCTKKKEKSSKNSSDAVLVSTLSLSNVLWRQTCECIIAFHQQTTSTSQPKEQPPSCFHHHSSWNGISLVTATKFLEELLVGVVKKNGEKDEYGSNQTTTTYNAVYALCCLPFRWDDSVKDDDERLVRLRYSIAVLKLAMMCCPKPSAPTIAAAEAFSKHKNFLLAVLKRLSEVVANVTGRDDLETTTTIAAATDEQREKGTMMKMILLEHFLIWRKSCSCDVDVRTAWIRCLYDLYYRYPYSIGFPHNNRQNTTNRVANENDSSRNILDLCQITLEIENSTINQYKKESN